MELKTPTNFKELNETYQELFKLDDPMLIPLLATVILSTRTKLPSVWLYLIGPASGGKTSALSAFSKVPFVTQVSDFTPNTLLSGAQSNEHETSLLKKLGNNFVIVMKDFTTILSKSEETQNQLMAQLREVYDGHIVKYTGLGKAISWGEKDKPSRCVFIMASTEAIYKIQERFSEMGSRGLNYVLESQDRKETAMFALQKTQGFDEKLLTIQDRMRDYISNASAGLPEVWEELPEDFNRDIVEVADFITLCRSTVLRDYRGVQNLALSAEFPMRVSKSMASIAKIMIHLNGGVLSNEIKACIFKTGFDSIPKQTRIALKVLAENYRVNSGGVAQQINYPIKRAQEWLENLNMFEVVKRMKIDRKEFWEMKDEYRKIMFKYFPGLQFSDVPLVSDDIRDGESGFKDWTN